MAGTLVKVFWAHSQASLVSVNPMLTFDILWFLFLGHLHHDYQLFLLDSIQLLLRCVTAASYVQVLLTFGVDGFANLSTLFGLQELLQKDITTTLAFQLGSMAGQADDIRASYEIGKLDDSVAVIQWRCPRETKE